MRERDIVWSRWDEVDRVFEEVLDHPPEERAAAAARLCGGDADLSSALADLLALSDAEADLRPGPELLSAFRADQMSSGSEEVPAPGDRVGRYSIVGILGRGGMATVYEAERSDGMYDQVVALKVLRRGLDTDRIVGRFLAERQILSDFDHPNIARLLDGGATADGRPFLVMEKVDGAPLTSWADEARLDIEARLRLFLQVCDAVQEAHRRAVVHRDLKPSNILVDGRGRVKLLDFGIAKLLDGQADHTEIAHYPLTRRWASPEQIRGEPATTSSDVYQLGLILFELLTGVGPPDHGRDDSGPTTPRPPRAVLQALDRLRAAEVAERRGTSLAALDRMLRGDLETIVGKSLEPAPLDRYGSAEELAGEIRLHLARRPIRARPASRVLRFGKWLRRNTWAVPVAAGIVLAVGTYMGATTVNARRLEAERNEARAQAERAERIKGFLTDLFRTADPWDGPAAEQGPPLTVLEALSDAPGRIERELAGDPVMQADLLTGVASILYNLDRYDEARPLVERAIELRRGVHIEPTPDMAADLQVLADVVGRTDPDSSATLRRRALEMLRTTVPPDDPRLADALAGYFGFEVRRGAAVDPRLGEQALRIYERAGEAYHLEAATVLSALAQEHVLAGRLAEAEVAARDALHRMSAAVGAEHVRTAITGGILAGVLDSQQRFEEAVPIYRESIRGVEAALGPTHNQTLTIRNNLATTLHALGRLDEAIAMHREIVDATRRSVGTDDNPAVASSLQNLAGALADNTRWAEADSLSSLAADIYSRTLPTGHYLRAFPLLTRTEIMLALGDYPGAEVVAARALAILDAALPADHYALGVARCRLGAARVGLGDLEGMALAREALDALGADERTPAVYVEECARVVEGAGADVQLPR